MGVIGIAGFASIPTTGFVGFLFGLTFGSGALLYGSGILDEEDKKQNPDKSRCNNQQNKTTPQHLQYPTSPETTAARALPQDVIDLLDRKSRRDTYTEGLRIGQNLAITYLNNFTPEEYSKIREIEIIPEQANKFLGLPIGRKSLEVRIKKWIYF